MNNQYIKQVESTDTGMVIVKVFRVTEGVPPDAFGGRVALEFFNWGTLESKFIRAHAWADRRIEILTKYEEF
jgi:hypothetical protein